MPFYNVADIYFVLLNIHLTLAKIMDETKKNFIFEQKGKLIPACNILQLDKHLPFSSYLDDVPF